MTIESQPGRLRLSNERLGRLGDALGTRVEMQEIPGAVVLVAHHGEIRFFEPFGFRDREAAAAMKHDAIFRIDSLTKPVTSLGAMMLVEEGKICLGAPISEYIPALRDLKVAVKQSDGSLEFVSPRREATILDLLRHTAGFVSSTFGTTAVKQLYQDSGIDVFTGAANEYIAKLAALPLQFEPGTEWCTADRPKSSGISLRPCPAPTLRRLSPRGSLSPCKCLIRGSGWRGLNWTGSPSHRWTH
jgi:CubicO group peptidase (beta-lactamase class C family)